VKPEPARAPDIKLYPNMVPRSFHVTVNAAGEVLNLTNSEVTAPIYDDGLAVGPLRRAGGLRASLEANGHNPRCRALRFPSEPSALRCARDNREPEQRYVDRGQQYDYGY